MIPPGRTRPSYRKTILVYLLAIVGPTLGLLYLGVKSVQRQREAIANLTLSNLRLSGERLAEELERRTLQLAEECLSEPELSQLPLSSGVTDALTLARQMRTIFDRLGAKHPFARYFFVVQADMVRFPVLHTPLPRRLDEYLAADHSDGHTRFVALFHEAEAQELEQRRPEQALAGYRECTELSVSPELKALAEARVARCLPKVNQPQESEQTFRNLLEKYGEIPDPSHRPYSLVAALELCELLKGEVASTPEGLVQVYRELIQGRWELSAEQVEYFLAKFQRCLGASVPAGADSKYLRHFEFARAIQENFHHQGVLNTNQVYSVELKSAVKDYQIFYAQHSAAVAEPILIGFAAALDWVEDECFPRIRNELGLREAWRLTKRAIPSGPVSANPSKIHISFKALFPSWELSVASATPQALRATALRDTLVFGGVVLLILSVLVLGVALLLRDVSRETQLSRLRADLVSGVSHELKTPLTLIRLYGETLLYGENFPEEERRGYYQIITRESERLTQLIEKVLDFSRIDRGQKQYHLQEEDLVPVVTSTVEAYRQYMKRQGFTLDTELATALPPVRFDPDAVSEAVLNLVDNAARYSGESKVIHVRLRTEIGRVVFEVEDHGIGIAPEEREKIFQQFYRGPQRKEKGGYGLGLFLVKHIMDAHGGRVEVESEVGRGSVFRLILPTSDGERRMSNAEP